MPTLAEHFLTALGDRSDAGLDARCEPFAHDVSDAVWDHLDRLGLPGLFARKRQVNLMVRDEEMVPSSQGIHWEVDPIPLVFGSEEWDPLADAVKQRARLLNAILTDLYGERRLIRERVFPGELLLSHDGYLLPAYGITQPGAHQLPLAAFDLARGAAGWTVITDRAQAPAGIGFALAHRRLIKRVMDPLFRKVPAHRLRGVFDVLQAALQAAAPPGVANPHIALLTAGPQTETSYDQSLIATLLGSPVVQSDDLLVRNGEIWMRTPKGSRRIHVIQRRVDGAWSDSLDLRPDSRLGVAGLLAAARRGSVGVVNPPGAGVLENTGMAPYLQAASRLLLSEDLELTSPQTWWCGDPASLDHVLKNLEHLTIRPTSRSNRPTIIVGAQLSASEREDLAARIKADPNAWAAQEPIQASTAPVVTPAGLRPRALALRTFALSQGADYGVMPGGLAKVAAEDHMPIPINRLGVIYKDTWVLTSAAAPVSALTEGDFTHPAGTPAVPALAPRAGADLYWFGRYAERVEWTTRLVGVTDSLISDYVVNASAAGAATLEKFLAALGTLTGHHTPAPAAGEQAESDHAMAERMLAQLRTVLLDRTSTGTVAYAIDRVSTNVIATRELMSPETVAVVSELVGVLNKAAADQGGKAAAVELSGETAGAQGDADAEAADTPAAGDTPAAEAFFDPQILVTEILKHTLALSGLAAESLVRDEIWSFIDAGRRLERAQSTVALMRHTLTNPESPVADAVLTEAVLRTCDTSITYRRRMAAGVGASQPVVAALELLVADPTNPRSVRYQLDRIVEHYERDENSRTLEVAAALRKRIVEIAPEDFYAPDRLAFAQILSEVHAGLRELSAEIERTQFAPPHNFAVQEWSRQ